jgi:hypothetical protein
MTNNDLTVVDTVAASTLEENDNITFLNQEGGQEIMTLTKVIDSGDSILVTGDSYVTGDRETYIFPTDREVDLWIV